ncbi:NitT/TauT family transport system ATP-binding protein [Paraburkholderia sp. HC6.4b]|uniref:ABC transporter ATP-binding protein n=1 Tax=unclassified Paraburkholderia TaxID=2615204 RepID=UPI00182D0D18|nr:MULTISPECIES: ABC transporter ATP-binding protein [unclassified Paraburkholderia]MBB5406321.1 NitT/TauT family transport system ATP-binding protein [Paraburkholderia sp. HC6.4b]MBB5448719.1 NitT/TauT family transport system ATP-binding protein [Paraburkholderia sp. Kb1A]
MQLLTFPMEETMYSADHLEANASGISRTFEPRRAANEAPGDVVVLRDVGMTYTTGSMEIQAIGCISASIKPGRFVTIVGPSGCGKSTLLEIVAGLRRPTSGAVLIDGKPVTGPTQRMAMVFQEDSTLPWRSVLDNVAFGLEVAGMRRRERNERAHEMIRLVGLQGFEGQRPAQLSGGMKQRVAIARALAMDPQILLMDEPFGALDQQTRWMVGAELTRIWEAAHKSVMFVTHDIQESVLLSDEVWVLSKRPSRIKGIVNVDLERPRPSSLIRSAEFHALITQVWDLLSEEFDIVHNDRAQR